MISTKDNCLFVHIPKVAGQSIELFFVERMGLKWNQRDGLLLRPNKEPLLGPPRLAHLYAEEYTKFGYTSKSEFDSLFKFSFVRNPWSRLVSEFTYRRALGHSGYQQGFKHFVLESFPTPDRDNYITGVDHFRHIVPQSRFLYDDAGNCLVDFIGRFESLQDDFAKVCESLKINSAILPHKNSTQSLLGTGKLRDKFRKKLFADKAKPHYSAYYCSETLDFVNSFYKEDIARFGYKFELH
ncbi:hypothetical protein PSECIP111854_01861 [Pseudoalteromonas sp. CIP111854]|uniref:Sulfotransferase family protein n=1 Tax=Pseudoalteromonas holothuriae TaxID=2963714 RepID=A0A9W4QWU6_9GAMM|nr:sulfotransferase family protein [Pseudoalteromonas sp. CIP111854]CAH9056775.1 hypothetical protein PSECIP111854_01861 [Pseudoalteromonas sp. CIP111854]